MAQLSEIVAWCDERTRRAEIPDFGGAKNGLQIANRGEVTKIGAAVDAGREPFEKAIAAGVDFLIVHHGPFWNPPIPLTGVNYQKVRLCVEGNLGVYGSHLPLDCHPEIGNNALVAKALGVDFEGTFNPYEGNNVAFFGKPMENSRLSLRTKLKELFPNLVRIEAGPEEISRVGIQTGSGSSALPLMARHGLDTLITGELSQHHFNMAQELGVNVFLGGHYATEVFGVQALAREAAEQFGLDWTFIETSCPL